MEEKIRKERWDTQRVKENTREEKKEERKQGAKCKYLPVRYLDLRGIDAAALTLSLSPRYGRSGTNRRGNTREWDLGSK